MATVGQAVTAPARWWWSRSKKVKWISGTAAVIVLLGVAGSGSSEEQTQAATPSSPAQAAAPVQAAEPTSAPEPTAKPTEKPKPTPTPPAQVGEAVLLAKDGWTVNVTAVRKGQRMTVPFSQTKHALGVYVEVTLALHNEAKEAQTLGKDRFEIRDDAGRTYEAYQRSGEVGSKINPGLTGTGTVVFDVPGDATGLVLRGPGGLRVQVGNVGEITDGTITPAS